MIFGLPKTYTQKKLFHDASEAVHKSTQLKTSNLPEMVRLSSLHGILSLTHRTH